jgi:serpin B
MKPRLLFAAAAAAVAALATGCLRAPGVPTLESDAAPGDASLEPDAAGDAHTASLDASLQSDAGGDAHSALDVEEVKSSLARSTAPGVGAAKLRQLVEGNNAFALALHQKLKEPGKNLMSAPYSVSTALAMTWAGARGATEEQIAAALHFPFAQEGVHTAFNALELALMAPAPCRLSPCDPAQAFTFKAANSAWAQRGYPFESAYLDTLAANYGAGVHVVDFQNASEPARLAINDWVAEKTEDKIKDLLSPGDVGPLTRVVLTNAVYFKGLWEIQFDPKNTAPAAFHLLDGSSAEVPTMHQSLQARGFADGEYQAVELPYRVSRYAMLIVAPAQGTFESFEAALDPAKLAAIDASLEQRPVTLALPKLKFEWRSSLREALEALGVHDAFSAQADLTGIADTHELYVSDVVHQTFVALDEYGTEAAAATAVIAAGAGLPPPPIAITVDRPFLFAIRELGTGQIVFLGRVVDPR